MVNILKTSREITKKLTAIENKVKRKLQAFYNLNIKGNILPTEAIRRKYDNIVKNMIRATVQEAYFKGTDIVTDQVTKINSNFEVFISVTDIQNISSLTDKLNNQFWKTADRLHRRETEFIAVPNKGLQPEPVYDVAAALLGLGAFIAYQAFNTAVTSKLQALTQTANSITVIRQTQPILVGEQQLLLTTEFDLPLTGKIMYLTQEDAKVDLEICEPLNRTVYDVGDPDIPIPPEDTHPHCRCRLIPVLSEDVSF